VRFFNDDRGLPAAKEPPKKAVTVKVGMETAAPCRRVGEAGLQGEAGRRMNEER